MKTLHGFNPLTGLQRAWFDVYSRARYTMDSAKAARGSNFGIAVNEDRYSLQYQVADRRMCRASLSLTGWPYACPVEAKTFDARGLRDTTNEHLEDWWKRWWKKGKKLRAAVQKLNQEKPYVELEY